MIEKLIKIQAELQVPKSRHNKFGNYYYRSAEDIVDAAKPLCHREGFVLTLTDEMVEVGGRVYVKATAKLSGLIPEHYDSNEAKKGGMVVVPKETFQVETHGWAREAVEQKGMADAQITGATSSYARKYALNGLFAIDDVADADATNTHDTPKSVKTAVNNNDLDL